MPNQTKRSRLVSIDETKLKPSKMQKTDGNNNNNKDEYTSASNATANNTTINGHNTENNQQHNALELLTQYTVVVSDTGEFDSIKKYR